MVKKILFTFCILHFAFCISSQGRDITASWDTRKTSAAKYQDMSIYQGENINLTLTARNATLTTNETAVWELMDWQEMTGIYWSVTGTIDNATSGIVSFAVLPYQANLNPTNYKGFVKTYEGTNLLDILVAQKVTVNKAPQSWLYSMVPATNYPWNSNAADLAVLQAAYSAATNALAEGLQTEEALRLAGDAALTNNMATATNALWNGIDSEESARGSADEEIYTTMSNATASCSGGWYNQSYFTLAAGQRLIGSDPVYLGGTNYDAVWTQPVYTNYVTDYSLAVSVIHNESSNTPAFTSGNTNIVSVDAEGYCSFVAAGTAAVTVTLGDYSRVTNLALSAETSAPATTGTATIVTGLAGSARKAITDDYDSRMVAGKDKEIFTTQNHGSGIYVRNTNCWAYGHDLTCVSPWNSTYGKYRAGTLISPRHIIFANHYNPAPGSTIRFVDLTNGVHDYTMTDWTNVAPTDIGVGVLDEDVDTDKLSFAKVLPSGWSTYLPTPNVDPLPDSLQIPALCLDQEEKAISSDFVDSYAAFGWQQAVFTCGYLTNRIAFYENKISGDSGNPAFLIISNQPIILTTWFYGGGGLGPDHSYYKQQINAAMTNLGGGYTLTEYDLSVFTNYLGVPPSP